MVIGFSWFSFVFAILITVGFFAGTIDGMFNAIMSGAITAVVLGSMENSLVEFLYGAFVAGVYKGYFGGHIVILIITGIIIGYLSNAYLKEPIRGIVDNLGISWL
ncbi:hypothetical protein [uncultured Methanobrevibacter sp.]|uniref:hypothetical protein n=1 Tax=uncultured Methanobrevibacter sp. TaxID=253161 RepID=UPI0025D02887|nr:hypothetical protein [uncultured Methanobrevibacter sp.]